MIVPAAIYVAINWHSAETLNGWAIPAATDIAFALGVLALLGRRVPNSLKLFLTALAIIDDLGAIAIIALFYTSHLAMWALGGAAACCGVAVRARTAWACAASSPISRVGAILWLCVLESGVHATVAGILLALFIPLKPGYPRSASGSRRCSFWNISFTRSRPFSSCRSSRSPMLA